jgi:hypothetical protein
MSSAERGLELKTGAMILIGIVSASIVVGLTIAVAVNVIRATKDPYIITADAPPAPPGTPPATSKLVGVYDARWVPRGQTPASGLQIGGVVSFPHPRLGCSTLAATQIIGGVLGGKKREHLKGAMGEFAAGLDWLIARDPSLCFWVAEDVKQEFDVVDKYQDDESGNLHAWFCLALRNASEHPKNNCAWVYMAVNSGR